MTKRLVFTVTNDLIYDQRMNRICSSLATTGYNVLLVGRKSTNPLSKKNFDQKRLPCLFKKGKLFYLEFNLRLLVYLCFLKFDLVCAIDLDTIVPCYLASTLKKRKRVYDAHELFCEMKEVVSRPYIYRIWKTIEKKMVPRFYHGYTVNTYISNILKHDYNVNYSIIRNMPVLDSGLNISSSEDFILYQGAVNHGRSFETLIPAFQWVDIPLFIYGEGNFFNECRQLIKQHHLEGKVFLKGGLEPDELKEITPKALLGITIFENKGLSNYYSLANRFFDYIHAGIPQVCVDYPAYKEINDQFNIGVLIKDLSPRSIASAINNLVQNKKLQEKLKQNCLQARKKLNWQAEEEKLISFYETIFQVVP
jgi:glycosyltransferase involved in cell wall biosynthesis